MTDDPSSPSKKLIRETRTKNSVRMSCILARVFSRARNLFRVGHSSVPSKFLVRVSRTSFLDGELGSSVMGLSKVEVCRYLSAKLHLSLFHVFKLTHLQSRLKHVLRNSTIIGCCLIP